MQESLDFHKTLLRNTVRYAKVCELVQQTKKQASNTGLGQLIGQTDRQFKLWSLSLQKVDFF